MSDKREWEVDGTGRMTDAQRKMLNAICGDLADQVNWHGNKLSKDDWRHMLSGTMLGWRMMPAINRGEGAAGFIMLGGSSLDLSKSLAMDAITCGLEIGDNPSGQGVKAYRLIDGKRDRVERVVWCDAVLKGLGFPELAGAA